MERDYENLDDIDNLTPAELRARVQEALRGHAGLTPGDINVHVENGLIRLIGRVGTASEARIAEHVVTDQLGLTSVRNELVVSNIRRDESSEDIEEHLVEEDRASELLLGDRALPFSDEAQHLADTVDDDVFGTTDMQRAVEDGVPYVPPESATPEGFDDPQEREGFGP